MCRLTIFASHCLKNASSSSKDGGIWWDPRAWSVPNEKMNTPNVEACAVINSTSKSEVFPTWAPLPNPKEMKASLSNSFLKMQLQNCVFPNFNLQILSSKCNLRSSFINLFNFKFSKTCWKGPKLYKRSLTHFEKMSLARWFWAFFLKVFCLVKWAKTNDSLR